MFSAVTAPNPPNTTESEGPGLIPAARTIAPRRALPNGRAVAGALLVTAAATGAFLVATNGRSTPSTSYLVLTSAVAVGEPIGLDDIVAEPLDLGDVVAASVLTSTIGLEGAIALRDLRAGELLSADDLLASTTTDGNQIGAVHELSIPVSLDRSPAVLLPGDRVTLLATVRGQNGLTTLLAAEDVRVLELDTDRAGIGVVGAVLRLGIDRPEVVVEITHLAQVGELTVVRTTRALADSYPATVTELPAHLIPETTP